MPRRYEDWPERMTLFLAENRHRPFNWNGWCCALWVLAFADALTGSQHYDAIRPHCTDETSSLAHLAALGGMDAAASLYFGLPLDAPLMAQRGDVVIVDNDGDRTFGVVDLSGRHVLILSEDHGLISVPYEKTTVLTAWRL